MSLPTPALLAMRLLHTGLPLDLLPDLAWPTPTTGTDFTPPTPSC